MLRCILPLFIFVILTAGLAAVAQQASPADSPAPFEDRQFGAGRQSCGNAVVELADGGFVVCGYTDGGEHGRTDALVARFDQNGKLRWRRTYGGRDNDHAWDILELPSGELIVLGYTETTRVVNEDAFLMKLDADGREIWRRTYGGPAGELAWSLVRLADGDLAFVGQTRSFGAGDWDVLVIRTDPDGKERWRTLIGGPGLDRAFSIDATQDGGVIVTGMNREPGRDDLDILTARLDRTGKVLWQLSHGGTKNDIGHGVRALADGDFLVTGYGESFSRGGSDLYVMRLGPDGKVKWLQHHGGPRDERGMMSDVMPDGTFIAVGYEQRSDDERDWDAALWSLDAEGALTGHKTLPGGGFDRGVMVRALREGGIIVTGWFGTPGPEARQAFLVRTARPE